MSYECLLLYTYYDSDNYTITEEVSECAVRAATDYVTISCQQTAFIAGRGLLSEEVERYKSGKC